MVHRARAGRSGQGSLALAALAAVCLLGLAGCEGDGASSPPDPSAAWSEPGGVQVEAVNFDHQLDGYRPRKKKYNFYFTYKTVHPWWDAVALGIEDAARQFEELGVTVDYEYLAPASASAQDQIRRLEEAAARNFDVIGVDVADVEAVTPAINALIDQGQRVMTFSSSDASREDGCRRIAYVGNTHNYEDGADLTRALCEKLGGRGKVAVLVGTRGAPCHEDRARGAQDVIAQYPDMEVVEIAYDEDRADKAYDLTREFLARHSDLAGIVCCNMSNPVGAARAVLAEALGYLRDGVIYALGVQDCYSIGFNTVQVAVKIADGLLPGEEYSEMTEESTTIVYQDGAAAMLQTLYGEID